MNNPLVSVVIPSMNSARTIHFTLASICQQTYKNVEIIVVDNFSTDETRNIAKRYGAKVYVKGPERATQLNFGIHQAKGDYIFETGSDMVSETTYIEEAVAKCEVGYNAIYASVISRPHRNFWSKVKGLERQTYIGSNEVEAAHFFSKRIWNMIGGYDTNLISVEEDFQHRLDQHGLRTGRIKAKEIHLFEATSLKEVAQKSFYYGMYIRSYLKKYPVRGTRYLFPLRLSFIYNIHRLIRHPILSVGLVIYKTVQYGYGLAGLLASFKYKPTLHKEIYENPTHQSTT